MEVSVGLKPVVLRPSEMGVDWLVARLPTQRMSREAVQR